MADRRVALVIEDDQSIRTLVAYALEEDGIDVREAETGETGLALAARERPDVVVLDIWLPDVRGPVVAERLREMHPPGIPIVVITAVAQPGDLARIQPAAAFVKPFDLNELVSAVTQAIAPRSDRGGTQPRPPPAES